MLKLNTSITFFSGSGRLQQHKAAAERGACTGSGSQKAAAAEGPGGGGGGGSLQEGAARAEGTTARVATRPLVHGRGGKEGLKFDWVDPIIIDDCTNLK